MKNYRIIFVCNFLFFAGSLSAMKKRRSCPPIKKCATKTCSRLYYWGVTQVYKYLPPNTPQDELMSHFSPFNEDDPKYVKALIRAGVEPTKQIDSVLPIMQAVKVGHLKSVTLLSTYYTDLNNIVDPDDELTVLGKALDYCYICPEMLKILIKNGFTKLHKTTTDREFINAFEQKKEGELKRQSGKINAYKLNYDYTQIEKAKQQKEKVVERLYQRCDKVRKLLNLQPNHS